MASNKVPFLGWNTGGAFTSQPKWGFGIDGNYDNPTIQLATGFTQLASEMGYAKTPAKVKVAFIAENIAAGINATNSLSGVSKYEGWTVAYKGAPIPVIGTTNYAPYAQSIISSGANLVWEVLDSADSVGLAAALKSAGYKGTITNGVTYYPGQLGRQPNEEAALNGVVVGQTFPTNENNTPATRQEQKDLSATGQPPELTDGVSIGYWTAIVLEQMLKATLKNVGGNPSKVTGAALQKTVTGGFTYKDPIAGGIGTETFPAAETVPTGCATLLKVSGANYKQIDPYECQGLVDIATGKKINPQTGKPIS